MVLRHESLRSAERDSNANSGARVRPSPHLNMSKARRTLRTKKSTRNLWGLASLPLLLAATPALAQEAQLDGEVSIQRFDPAPGKNNFITTRAAQIEGHMTWTAGLLVNYAFEPFIVKQCAEEGCPDDTTVVIPVVENMITGDLMGSLNLIDRIQIGLKIPISWVKGQGLTTDGQPVDGGLSAVGLGDVQIEGKGRLYGKPGGLYVLGAYAYVTAPTGTLTSEGSYMGNSSPTFALAGTIDGKMGPLTYGANIGGLLRSEATIGGSKIGPEGRWSLAAGFEVSPIIRLIGDVFGSTNFGSNPGGSTIEFDAAAQVIPLGNQLVFNIGAGAGLLKGVGTPTARALLGVTFSAEVQDRDGDGLTDNIDACPEAPEDKDGFQDDDGCPELDNDEDSVLDNVDKCPNQSEDLDGFEDNDGCPDLDNDKDGIVDVSDRCPLEPETKNGYLDDDGCPDVKDTDQDGVGDTVDKCINEPEDTDGFQDEDGCPDPDNDGDGIPDNQDECIDVPEDGSGEGAEITDGCPAEGVENMD